MDVLRRLMTALVLWALLASYNVAPASAGSYVVVACDGGVNRSWVAETSDSLHADPSTICPAHDDFSGLLMTDRLNSAGVRAGYYAHWAFRAPLGNWISHIQLRRWIGMEGGGGWTLYGRTADGATI